MLLVCFFRKYKNIKKVVKIALCVLLGLVILLVSLTLSLQLRSVQNYVTQKASQYLSHELQTTIKLESLYFKPFNAIQIKNFYIEDQEKDTLLFFGELQADLDLSSIWNSELIIDNISISDGKISIKKQLDSTTNFTFIQQYFSPDRKEKPSKKLDLILSSATLKNIELYYKNYSSKHGVNGINFGDLHVYSLNGKFDDIDYVNHIVRASVQDLTFKEKSGVFVKKLNTTATIDSNRMEFSQLDLEMNSSYIRDYVLLEYANFAAFSDFIHQVSITGNLRDSRITSKDISLFAPQVNVTNFDVLINGNFSGKVDNLQAKEMQIRTGKQTWLQGEVSIKGLPNIEQTFFDMDLSQLITNRKDLETLVSDLSGKELFALPVLFDRFGTLSYQGQITGFYNDFITKGIFKTKLGDIIADVNLKLKGDGKYSGEVLINKFNLGDLIQNEQFGYVALRANAKGEGFSLENLYENIEANIQYIDYKDYRYKDMLIDGAIENQIFAGNINVDDENLAADFSGKLSLDNDLPEFGFTAKVDKMDLNNLNLSQDSLVLSGTINSNFVGKSLNDMIGELSISDLLIEKSEQTAKVDSLLLLAEGSGKERVLAIQSNVLDVTIKGEFDLNTFPSYFKSVAKHYIPSWETKIIEGGAQEFDMEMKLKDFSPFALVFASDVTIPEEVIVNGQFSSENETASLNGFIPLITYKDIKVNNLIFDQTTNDEYLNLFVTSDRIDITDSLYINNVNFANVLRNDSLNFNIKLSDPDATNQLDLNGLIEFSNNVSPRLSLLPSDVIINHEEWRIQDQVRFDFEDGKARIDGLELSQGNQVVRIDGLVSDSTEEVLTINLQNFSLKTLNPLSKTVGIELEGLMEGDIEIRSLLKNPFIQSDINAQRIEYNKVMIGDLVLNADYDRSSKLVNLEAEINNEGIQSLFVEGTYNAIQEDNSLDLKVKLSDSQLVLFTPFLRNLVSDLSGSVTAELAVVGTPFNPSINGTASFKNAGMVVNYLKTPYVINDKVQVENSKIVINNLAIVDKDNHKAVANGTVDMSTPLNPTIQIEISAENFMVLNTTAKDNPLYYGLAYGTGSFSFQGPTNNMNIRIDAQTNSGTVINIPLNAAGTITDRDFITFIVKDSSLGVPRKNYFQGLTMTMDLTVDPDAEINIFTDLGKLSGRGEGLLSMNITSLGDFEMFGDYAIQEGEFEFTAQDFINKIFEINQGGSIRWTGNPTEALINLTAIYQVRTSVRPLYIAAGRNGTDQRVLAQAEMILNGNLLHPDISFGIDFPTDSYVKDELQSYLSDANNVNQQALSLIVRRSFAPGTGTDLTRELNTTVFSAGTELAFNQLNNIISQSLNLNFVDFNIRSFNEASASIRLLNDRLVLTGGVTDRRGQLNDFNVFGKDVASDVEALYLLRKSGNLLLRASNRLNNRNFLNPEDEYVSALGLVYRQEFDTFGEFFRKIFNFRTKKIPATSLESKVDSTEVN
ncbi:translocation/assembly module TamB domain-containing protein [Albibacterium sp.]|uniref:translocation/assembly module TamB domain-containing protein n=1 Tax=Albibacterium sp. TaxID=2952885 RepID=UPI002CA6D006|nr:translocation/assembly module TamB domain-containing protein [Albibacterium sp.]HUH20139.1 translocation/assembly module TamB domain-containing protein [Albibacterium sp.]